MKKINFLQIILALFICSTTIKASSCITLASGGTTIYVAGPSYSFGAAATLSGLSTGNYMYSLSRSGSFTTSNLALSLNGNGWAQNTFATVVSSNNINISGMIPSGVGCGQTETVVMTINDIYGSAVCTFTFYITKANQSMNGSVALCVNTAGTYSVSSPVTIGGTYTWTTNTAGWLINGLASPVTTTTNSVTLTAPATKGTTNLCVSNPNMCQSLCYTVSSNDLATPVFATPHVTSVCKTNSVTWHVNPVFGATSYTWTSTNSNVSLNQAGASCEIIGNIVGSSLIKVKANNACGSSAQLSGTIVVTSTAGCALKMKPENNTDQAIEETKALIFPNPADQVLSVEITSVEANNYNISIYDMLGKRHSIQTLATEKGFNKASLDLSKIENGLYLLIIDNGITVQKERIIINH